VLLGGVALLLLGVAGFVFPMASDFLGSGFQADLKRQLDQQTELARWAGLRAGAAGHSRTQVAAWAVEDAQPTRTGTQSGPRRLGSGAALCRIEIPRIGLSVAVVDGVEPEHLAKGPGHYPGTAMPGDPDNCCIAGHRVTFGHPFRRLDEVTTGSEVIVTASGQTYRYVVTDRFVVPESDTESLARTGLPELTLTTCHPPHRSTERLVVRAQLEGRPTARRASGGRQAIRGETGRT
jgi:sortase A